MLSERTVLSHMDYEAAAKPAATGRPLEMFIYASDYGWSATLTQRPTPHAAPKVISIVAKGFTDVQRRWSAMERELFALWQGVVSHERLIKGLRRIVTLITRTICFRRHSWTIVGGARRCRTGLSSYKVSM